MAITALQSILDRMESWPEDRQRRAAVVLASFEAEEHDKDLQVSDEDLAEIDRRLADVNAPSMSLEEFDRRFARWLR